jgi:hypothetical protein
MAEAKYQKLIDHFVANQRDLKGFKALADSAQIRGEQSFKFVFPWGQEWEVDVGYAKYFVIYINDLLRRMKHAKNP